MEIADHIFLNDGRPNQLQNRCQYLSGPTANMCGRLASDHKFDAPSGFTLADVASPDAPTHTNEAGGSQSHIPARFDLIDGAAMFEMAKVLHAGADKYGENNWQLIEVKDHLNHLLMHTFAYLAGDTSDEHLSHILCRATFAMGVSLKET